MDKFVISIPKGLNKRPSSAISSTSSLIVAQVKKQCQMFIDLGQKSFGSSRQCLKCGMFYLIGDDDDEKKHDQFCKKIARKHLLPSLTNHRVLIEYPDNNQIIRFNYEKKLHHDVLNHVMKEVENDLGTSSDFFNMENSDKTIYLYLVGSELAIVGFLMAEEIFSQHFISITKDTDISKIMSSPTTLDNHHHHHHHHSDCNYDEIYNPDKTSLLSSERKSLGIRILWTRKEYRNQSIATKLVDIARRYFYFGKLISIQELGFSQPTKEGLNFALSYSKSNQIFAYA